MDAPLHPTEHRGYRELYVALRQLSVHWERLGGRLAGASVGSELAAGAGVAAGLLAELERVTEARGLYGRPVASGIGAAIALARNAVGDLVLERNQAVRLALLDVAHARSLVVYLERVAQLRADGDYASFCHGADHRLEAVEHATRGAYIEMAAEPDRAIEPTERTTVGWAASRVGVALGRLGELVDRRAGGRGR